MPYISQKYFTYAFIYVNNLHSVEIHMLLYFVKKNYIFNNIKVYHENLWPAYSSSDGNLCTPLYNNPR